jgi:hypothetical protein
MVHLKFRRAKILRAQKKEKITTNQGEKRMEGLVEVFLEININSKKTSFRKKVYFLILNRLSFMQFLFDVDPMELDPRSHPCE